LRAEEVLFAADLDRAVARADVDLAIDRTGRLTVHSCGLSDSEGGRLVLLRGLVVGVGESPEQLGVDRAVAGRGHAGVGRRAVMLLGSCCSCRWIGWMMRPVCVITGLTRSVWWSWRGCWGSVLVLI